MSVRTTADEAKDRAKENVNDSIKDLNTALDLDTWGSSDFSEEYKEKMEDAIILLMKVRRLL